MRSMKDLLLAIDCGTQSLKALVFDLNGNLLDKEQTLFTPYFSENPGWAEQDPGNHRIPQINTDRKLLAIG